MANAAASQATAKPVHATTAIEEAARRLGWAPMPHRVYSHVWGRGTGRLIIGYSPTGRTVECALFYPQGFGTGYIDDPTPRHSVGGSGGYKLEVVLAWLATTPWTCPQVAQVVVIACAARKLNRAAPARELYDTAHFRCALRAAEAHAARTESTVMILSAKHGLLALDAFVVPYDIPFAQAGHIQTSALSDQLTALGVQTITALLPRRYLSALTKAVDALNDTGAQVKLIDLFAQAPGIGYQRAVLSSLLRDHHHDSAASAVPS